MATKRKNDTTTVSAGREAVQRAHLAARLKGQTLMQFATDALDRASKPLLARAGMRHEVTAS